MKRSRLKNIINKSKSFSNKQEVRNPFNEFKKSLPIEVDDNYRLEAAWKAYGSPKDYKEAVWQGLIQPIDEDNVKLPSIGYNEETDEYEYLNSGKENETVAKDIRVWDNDVIPFVQELKQGGFIRIYDEEKNCWKYSKNQPQKTQNEQGEVIDSFQKGGKTDKKEETDPEVESFKQGGQMNVIPEGALHARKNEMELAKEGTVTHKGIPVVDDDGKQQAEIERNEIIFNKEVTEKLENYCKQFNLDDKSQSEKDEIAIKAGKLLAKQIIENTDDRTGLIEEVANKE